MSSAAREAPPPWLTRPIIVGLALLLFYPLHVPYQNPDQDMPAFFSRSSGLSTLAITVRDA